MTFSFRPAKREGVGLIIALAGGTGSGKTFSAMELATGLAGGKRFALIDTEAGRAKHYADRFAFDHGDLRPPFRPDAYVEAIAAADAAGYPVIVVDSASHEHAGEGGLLDWHEEILDRMAGDDWRKRDACNMRAWVEPKMGHKAYVQKLLQLRAHVILCFRAEPKIEIAKGDNGKTEIREKRGPTGARGWFPVCEKNMPFEATCSFLFLAEKPGVPVPIKLQEQHRAMFDLGKPISRSTGEQLARWAAGGAAPAMAPAKPEEVEVINGEVVEDTDLTKALEMIALAQSVGELEAIKPHAAKLGADEKPHAIAAYKAKLAELRPARATEP